MIMGKDKQLQLWLPSYQFMPNGYHGFISSSYSIQISFFFQINLGWGFLIMLSISIRSRETRSEMFFQNVLLLPFAWFRWNGLVRMRVWPFLIKSEIWRQTWKPLKFSSFCDVVAGILECSITFFSNWLFVVWCSPLLSLSFHSFPHFENFIYR